MAGQLSAIALQSEAVLTGPDPDPALMHRVLGAVREGSVSALAEMRTMIGLLRADPEDGEPRTAPAGLDRLDPLLDTARSRGLRLEVTDDRPPGARPVAAVDLVAYRILQEGLTNAAKHAPGATVRVLLRHDADALVVGLDNELTDRPTGPPGTSGGAGLLGLSERVAAVGGSWSAGETRATGPERARWRVRARLPLRAGAVDGTAGPGRAGRPDTDRPTDGIGRDEHPTSRR